MQGNYKNTEESFGSRLVKFLKTPTQKTQVYIARVDGVDSLMLIPSGCVDANAVADETSGKELFTLINAGRPCELDKLNQILETVPFFLGLFSDKNAYKAIEQHRVSKTKALDVARLLDGDDPRSSIRRKVNASVKARTFTNAHTDDIFVRVVSIADLLAATRLLYDVSRLAVYARGGVDDVLVEDLVLDGVFMVTISFVVDGAFEKDLEQLTGIYESRFNDINPCSYYILERNRITFASNNGTTAIDAANLSSLILDLFNIGVVEIWGDSGRLHPDSLSKLCAVVYTLSGYRESNNLHMCPICGKVFGKSRIGKTYCSITCKQQASNLRRAER
jgi:hypothetical protein